MTTTMRKWALLCGIAALLAVNILSPVAQADELRFQDKTVTEGNKGGRGPGGGGRGPGGGDGGRGHGGGGGRHHGGSGWGWAGFGAAVGLGILSAVTSDNSPSYTYVEPAPSYQVVYPSTNYYYYPETTYVQPGYAQPTYSQPTYVQPNYAQPTYVQPNYGYGQTYAAPAPCNACP